MSATNCPRCGKPATGNFCSNCGASLGERFCNQCGSPLGPGARFCNQCGGAAAGRTPAPGTRAPAAREDESSSLGTKTLAWWVAGGVMVVLILLVAWPMVSPDSGPRVPAGVGAPGGGAAGGAGAGGPGAVDLSSMTPREAADALYDRVMRAIAAGDSAQAQQFLPMSIQAYGMARPLDEDGLFHLSALQRAAGDFEAALATAREGLGESPNHLLLLAAAGEAAAESGDDETARNYFGQLLEVWDEERSRAVPEYDLHDRMLPDIRARAEEYLGR